MKSVTYKGLKMGARLMEMEKTNRMNALFEFYSTLLTEKQMNYMELYYADDFSLGEIAEEYEVSRQAVYDNIKRTEKILEEYEKSYIFIQTMLYGKNILNSYSSMFKKLIPKIVKSKNILNKFKK